MSIILREVRKEDIPGVVELDKEIFSDDCYGFIGIRQYFDLFGNLFYIVSEGDLIVGYIIGGVALDQVHTKLGWILCIGVREKYRNRGIGRLLLEKVLDKSRAHGVSRVHLTVDGANASAIKLYSAVGFSKLHAEESYYRKGEWREVFTVAI